MVTITYRDVNWTDNNSNVIIMQNYNTLILNACILEQYNPPIITEDTWNGQTFPVQTTISRKFTINISAKETSISLFAKLQSCFELRFQDSESGLDVYADVKKGILIENVTRPENKGVAAQLSFFSETINTYPAIAKTNNYFLALPYESVFTYFVSDFAPTKYTLGQSNGIEGENTLLLQTKKVSNTGLRYVFYFHETEMIDFKKKFELGSVPYINHTTISLGTDNMEVSELPEGLYKIVASVFTGSIIKYY